MPQTDKMATHSSVLAWKIPRTEEPGGLQSMESQRVGHNWATQNAWKIDRYVLTPIYMNDKIVLQIEIC